METWFLNTFFFFVSEFDEEDDDDDDEEEADEDYEEKWGWRWKQRKHTFWGFLNYTVRGVWRHISFTSSINKCFVYPVKGILGNFYTL